MVEYHVSDDVVLTLFGNELNFARYIPLIVIFFFYLFFLFFFFFVSLMNGPFHPSDPGNVHVGTSVKETVVGDARNDRWS